MWPEDCSASWDFMLHRRRGFNYSEVTSKKDLTPACSRSRSRSTGSRREGMNLQKRQILEQSWVSRCAVTAQGEMWNPVLCRQSLYPFDFVSKDWDEKCVIRKPLPSPDSLQLPVLSYSHAVNVVFYWFSSPTVSLLSLFLSFFAFFMKQSISHYFSLSSHRGFF